jgi:hypothetical protein
VLFRSIFGPWLRSVNDSRRAGIWQTYKSARSISEKKKFGGRSTGSANTDVSMLESSEKLKELVSKLLLVRIGWIGEE